VGNQNKYKLMFKTTHQYYIYILASQKNGTLYIGLTNDLQRRVLEHKQKVNEGFTSKYDINMLVYFESFQYINDAILREKRLKKWNREWKINLIEAENKDWKDLSEEWYN
jgi:putative endonuclease